MKLAVVTIVLCLASQAYAQDSRKEAVRKPTIDACVQVLMKDGKKTKAEATKFCEASFERDYPIKGLN